MAKKLQVIGLNHKTAPIDIREKIAFNKQNITDAYKYIFESNLASEAVILSTCNRVELYLVHSLSEAPLNKICEWLSHFFSIEEELSRFLYQYLYLHEDQQAMSHILKVASGMDSMVIGESEIFGQVKQAYEEACKNKPRQPFINMLFSKMFHYAKLIRTKTEIGADPISVSFAAVKMIKKKFEELNSKTAMVIGTGRTIQLACQYLHRFDIGKLIVVNRSLHSAEELAYSYGGYGVQIESIREHLHKADIIVSATASPVPIVGKGMIETCLQKRSQKPMIILDIAVPRDIEPEVKRLEPISLYSIDDIQSIVDSNKKKRTLALDKAQIFIEQFVIDVNKTNEYNSRIKPIIKKYRQQNIAITESLLIPTIKTISKTDDQQEIIHKVEKFAYQLAKKLTHNPTIALQNAGEQDQTQKLGIIIESLGLDSISQK